MENKKSNLPKGGWVIGHIDLSALNQTCRPQKKIRTEIRRITDADLKEITNNSTNKLFNNFFLLIRTEITTFVISINAL